MVKTQKLGTGFHVYVLPSRSGKARQKGKKKKGQTLLRFDPLKHTSGTVAFKN